MLGAMIAPVAGAPPQLSQPPEPQPAEPQLLQPPQSLAQQSPPRWKMPRSLLSSLWPWPQLSQLSPQLSPQVLPQLVPQLLQVLQLSPQPLLCRWPSSLWPPPQLSQVLQLAAGAHVEHVGWLQVSQELHPWCNFAFNRLKKPWPPHVSQPVSQQLLPHPPLLHDEQPPPYDALASPYDALAPP